VVAPRKAPVDVSRVHTASIAPGPLSGLQPGFELQAQIEQPPLLPSGARSALIRA
jgi:hypothetical protein